MRYDRHILLTEWRYEWNMCNIYNIQWRTRNISSVLSIENNSY